MMEAFLCPVWTGNNGFLTEIIGGISRARTEINGF